MEETITRSQKKKVKEQFESFYSQDLKDEDTNTVVNNVDKIIGKTKFGPLFKFAKDIKLMCAMVKAYSKKEYKEIPLRTITMVVLSLIYVFVPLDIVPDLIPLFGLIDDAGIVGMCLKAVHKDLEDFKNWAQNNKPEYLK